MIKDIQAKAKALNKRIVLPEGEDARTLHAMKWIVNEGLAQPVLLGNPDVVLPLAKQEGVTIPDHVPLIHPASSEHREAFAQTYLDLRKHKGATEEKAHAAVADELVFGALMVRHDIVDGS
ncbi:MAG: phosphate acyltransferase, partial [Bacteroidota bacterium]